MKQATRSALSALALFFVGWLVAWINKERLLLRVGAPLIRDWENSPCSQGLLDLFPQSPAPSFFYLSALVASLLCLPFVARTLLVWKAPRALSREKGVGAVFLLSSYVAAGFALLSAHHLVVWPPLEEALRRRGWCGESWSIGLISTLNDYVARLASVALGLAAGLELVIVAVVLWRFRAAAEPQ